MTFPAAEMVPDMPVVMMCAYFARAFTAIGAFLLLVDKTVASVARN
jgi:hypothetical protein